MGACLRAVAIDGVAVRERRSAGVAAVPRLCGSD